MAVTKGFECEKEISTNMDAIGSIKAYESNWIVNFLRSRRFSSIIGIFFAGMIYCFTFDGGTDMISLGIVLFGVPIFLLTLVRLTYPMHHIKRYFRKNNVESAIKNDSGYMNVAISAYIMMPGKQMLRYIRKLNLEAAQEIEQQIAASRKK